MYGVLSDPLVLSGTFDDDIKTAYDFFQIQIYNEDKRPTLFGKKVFIEAHEKIFDWPQGFWHLISLRENHKFKVLPCVNDKNINICANNCNTGNKQITIKHGTEVRNVCLLRASRLPWIIDIIKLANADDPSVDVWRKSRPGKQSDKVYLRYNHNGADFVIILSAEKHFYRIVSAYPVFYSSEKETFDKDAKKYAWSYFDE